MNSLKMDANFMAPRGFAVGGGHHHHHHHHQHGGDIYGGIAEYGAIYGGKEGALKKHGEHAHKKVAELKKEAKARGIIGHSKMRKHELLKALGHEKHEPQKIMVVHHVEKKEKKAKKEKKEKKEKKASEKKEKKELKALEKLMRMLLKKK